MHSYAHTIHSTESFSGGVPKTWKTIRGGKRYWREGFLLLLAVAAADGTPQLFVTLTTNEMGWRDFMRDLQTVTG